MDIKVQTRGCVVRIFDLWTGLAVEHVPDFTEESKIAARLPKGVECNFLKQFGLIRERLMQRFQHRLVLWPSRVKQSLERRHSSDGFDFPIGIPAPYATCSESQNSYPCQCAQL